MPKTTTPVSANRSSLANAPYPTNTQAPKHAAIWNSADDEVLLQARTSGLNWQPIASRYFSTKTANACRKRHERLIERRHVEDWDGHKLELLALEYVACRKEMWELLSSRVGERWAVIEAKCMEKGLKTLQATARTAQRRTAACESQVSQERGNSDHHSDSGIGLGSDTEMEVGDEPGHGRSASWHAHPETQQQARSQAEHARSYSVSQLLPLYQPPPPITQSQRGFGKAQITARPLDMFGQQNTTSSRSPPEIGGRGGVSIQSMLSPAETQQV